MFNHSSSGLQQKFKDITNKNIIDQFKINHFLSDKHFHPSRFTDAVFTITTYRINKTLDNKHISRAIAFHISKIATMKTAVVILKYFIWIKPNNWISNSYYVYKTKNSVKLLPTSQEADQTKN